MSRTRISVVVVLVAVLAGLGALDRVVDDPRPASFGRRASAAMPAADDPDALSSTWYCPAGTAADGGSSDLSVVVANPLDQVRRGTVTWFTGEGERTSQSLQVGPRDVLTLRARDAVTATVVSAVVETEGGGTAVEQRIQGDTGTDAGPCASAPSTSWYLANGTTARDGRQLLFLFNPFPDDVIVDIALATDELREEPAGLQGLPVPPGSTTVVEVGEHVRRREVTAASIVARSGRFVAGRVQLFDGSDGRRGSSYSLAAPEPAEVWYFPDVEHTDDRRQAIHLANPGEEEAIVLLELVPDEGVAPEPLERIVPARSQVAVDLADVPGAAADVGHSATVRSINDVPVVAESRLELRGDQSQGWSSVLGAPRSAARWLLPASEVAEGASQRVVVANPSPRPVRASLAVLAGGGLRDLPDGQQLELAPADRVEIAVGEGIDAGAAPLLVEADGPVVVERIVAPAGGGVSVALGVPLS